MGISSGPKRGTLEAMNCGSVISAGVAVFEFCGEVVAQPDTNNTKTRVVAQTAATLGKYILEMVNLFMRTLIKSKLFCVHLAKRLIRQRQTLMKVETNHIPQNK